MTLERISGICCCCVLTSVAASGQQRSETGAQSAQGAAARSVVVERTHAASDQAPWRRVQTQSGSGVREVVVATSAVPDVEGRLAPIHEAVSETVRTSNAIETRRDVFLVGSGRQRQLLETTESRRETQGTGDASTVHTTWAQDINGRPGVTSRATERTRTSSGGRQTDTTLLMPHLDGTLREVERTQYAERQVAPEVIRHDSTSEVRDVNGQWQPVEIRRGEARDLGTSGRAEEETIQRRELNGQLVVEQKVVTRRSMANGQEHVDQEIYAPSSDELPRPDSRLVLSQRVRLTTTATADGGSHTVEEVEGRNIVAPNEPMRVVRRIVTTIRQTGAGRWASERQVFERDVNGQMRVVSNETEERAER